MYGIDLESDISLDLRKEVAFVKWVALDLGFGFGKWDRGAGDFDSAEEVFPLNGVSVVVDNYFDGLVG